MKLFRTAFWLGIVIYNLPNTGSESALPASQTMTASTWQQRQLIRAMLYVHLRTPYHVVIVRCAGMDHYELARQNKLVTPEPLATRQLAVR